jgi:hypothetical protein
LFLRTELIDELGDLHVEAAVLGDLQHLALLEPLQRLQALVVLLRPKVASAMESSPSRWPSFSSSTTSMSSVGSCERSMTV